MSLPTHITFTGVDKFTDLDKVLYLSKKYQIEWGVLIGGNPTKNRYPELDIINTVSKFAEKHNLNCALHLCGVFAQTAKNKIIPAEINIDGYKRFQINAIEYDLDSLGEVAEFFNKDIIFQHRKGKFPDNLHQNVYALHDESGGKGLIPSNRPELSDKLVGYAGGIGLDNVTEILQTIPDGNFWIDMETKLRTDDKFDLNICENICKKVWS